MRPRPLCLPRPRTPCTYLTHLTPSNQHWRTNQTCASLLSESGDGPSLPQATAPSFDLLHQTLCFSIRRHQHYRCCCCRLDSVVSQSEWLTVDAILYLYRRFESPLAIDPVSHDRTSGLYLRGQEGRHVDRGAVFDCGRCWKKSCPLVSMTLWWISSWQTVLEIDTRLAKLLRNRQSMILWQQSSDVFHRRSDCRWNVLLNCWRIFRFR